MPRMNKITDAAIAGDSRASSDGSPVGRSRKLGSPPYPRGIGDSRAKASDSGETPLGSKHFTAAGDKITKSQH